MTVLGLLFGGNSSEHYISIRSALNIIKNVDYTKYNILPIYIDINGNWFKNELITDSVGSHSFKISIDIQVSNIKTFLAAVDVVFPMIHGYTGENGMIQGLLECFDIPYIGCGVLSSALCIDKEKAKIIIGNNGIEIAPFFTIYGKHEYILDYITDKLDGFPVFVKSSSSGSSIGISKVWNEKDLEKSLDNAFLYDKKVLIEKAFDAYDIEIAVLEGADSNFIVSNPGLIKVVNDEFYSYNSKYVMDQGAVFDMDPDVPEKENLKEIALKIFKLLECRCLARVDFLMDKKTKKIIFNEINSIPGFTSISLYPKLIESSGISFTKMIDMFVEVAFSKKEEQEYIINNFKKL